MYGEKWGIEDVNITWLLPETMKRKTGKLTRPGKCYSLCTNLVVAGSLNLDRF
jgi:hypothetical protein